MTLPLGISCTTDGPLAFLAIDRPARKNALTEAMYSAMANALTMWEQDFEVRVVVLHGSEGIFSAGNDLEDFLRNPPVSNDASRPVVRFLETLSQFTKPIVAAVDGPAIGIGTTMLLHCDLVYASPQAAFQLPFVNLGLVPEAASTLLLPRLAGHQKSAELLMFGEEFSAQAALEIGLINSVVETELVVEYARAKAHQLSLKSASALKATKHLLRKPYQDAIATALNDEGDHFVEQLNSPEAIAAFSKFLQKRRPTPPA